jgi:hypothetical protein
MTEKDNTRMRSPLALLALTLLTPFATSTVASGRGIPHIDGTRAVTTGATLVLAGQANKGYKYAAADGSYTVKFPGKPKEQTQTVATAVGPIKAVFVIYEVNKGQRAYMSSSTQYKIDPRQYNVEKGLDGARDGMVKSTNATISKENRINYKGAPGREVYFTLKQGKGKGKVHLFVVNTGKGPIIYQVVVLDSSGKVDDADTNAFLSSMAFKPR